MIGITKEKNKNKRGRLMDWPKNLIKGLWQSKWQREWLEFLMEIHYNIIKIHYSLDTNVNLSNSNTKHYTNIINKNFSTLHIAKGPSDYNNPDASIILNFIMAYIK
jgi:hypothetical protein